MSTLPNGGRPPATAGSVAWDVNQDGTPDFNLKRYQYSGFLFMFSDLNGGRVMAGGGQKGFHKLNAGQTIASNLGVFVFAGPAQGSVLLVERNVIGRNAAGGGWALGDTGYIGFKFTSVAGTLFGWANVTIDGSPGGYKINEAWYNSSPGASIKAGEAGIATSPVPEPATCAVGLGALALGAAGLRRWRRQKVNASAC